MSPLIDSIASDPGVTTGVILGALGIVGFTVMHVAKEWRKVRQAEEVTALKTSLVERGLSADEIIKIIEAKPKSDDSAIPWF